MSELKTKKTAASVQQFLKLLKDDEQRNDCLQLLALMKSVTKEEPTMWGTAIVGFGNFHYEGKSGREGDWFNCGFAPRKGNISIYIIHGLPAMKESLRRLGKFKMGMSCLYVRRLSDIDMKVLATMVKKSHPPK